MKNVLKIIGLLLLGIVLMTSYSCSDDSSEMNENLSDISDESLFQKEIIVGWYFTWDEWGRKSKDCRGGGLCNFRFEAITIQVGAKQSQIYKDINGNLYTEIELDDSLPKEYNYEFFPIDDDISFANSDGKIYSVKSGLYPLDLNIGQRGGYRIKIYVQ